MDVRWARSCTSSRHKGKIHVVVGEGIYMHALCSETIGLIPDIVSENQMKRIDRKRLCFHCLKRVCGI